MTQMTINEDIIERCRRVPLHRLVGDHRLTRKIKIKCPFHQEDTPSCQLFPNGGYKCYGCGAHGNSIDFITNMDESFETAINELKKFI